jgi:hypothetical protein
MNDFRSDPLGDPDSPKQHQLQPRIVNTCIVECHVNCVPIPVVVAVELVSKHSEVLVDYSAEYWEDERGRHIQRQKSQQKDIKIEGLRQEIQFLRPQGITCGPENVIDCADASADEDGQQSDTQACGGSEASDHEGGGGGGDHVAGNNAAEADHSEKGVAGSSRKAIRKRKSCQHPGCDKTPSFGNVSDGIRLFCFEHKTARHINVKRQGSTKSTQPRTPSTANSDDDAATGHHLQEQDSDDSEWRSEGHEWLGKSLPRVFGNGVIVNAKITAWLPAGEGNERALFHVVRCGCAHFITSGM